MKKFNVGLMAITTLVTTVLLTATFGFGCSSGEKVANTVPEQPPVEQPKAQPAVLSPTGTGSHQYMNEFPYFTGENYPKRDTNAWLDWDTTSTISGKWRADQRISQDLGGDSELDLLNTKTGYILTIKHANYSGFSPDGKYLLFNASRPEIMGYGMATFVMNLATLQARQMTNIYRLGELDTLKNRSFVPMPVGVVWGNDVASFTVKGKKTYLFDLANASTTIVDLQSE